MAVIRISHFQVIKYISSRQLATGPVAVVITTIISWLIGFNHNKRILISDIGSGEVQQDINKFNSMIKGIRDESEARTTTMAMVKSEKSLHKDHGTSKKLLLLNHKITIAEYEIRKLKKDAHILRAKLRDIKFAAVKSGICK